MIAVSCGIKISAVHHVLSQYTRLTDGRTDRQNCDSNTVRCITCRTVKCVCIYASTDTFVSWEHSKSSTHWMLSNMSAVLSRSLPVFILLPVLSIPSNFWQVPSQMPVFSLCLNAYFVLVLYIFDNHQFNYHRECGVVMRSVASVCVCICVCPLRALTYQILDLDASFLVCRYIFRTSRSSISVMKSRSKSCDRYTGCVSKQHTETKLQFVGNDFVFLYEIYFPDL